MTKKTTDHAAARLTADMLKQISAGAGSDTGTGKGGDIPVTPG